MPRDHNLVRGRPFDTPRPSEPPKGQGLPCISNSQLSAAQQLVLDVRALKEHIQALEKRIEALETFKELKIVGRSVGEVFISEHDFDKTTNWEPTNPESP